MAQPTLVVPHMDPTRLLVVLAAVATLLGACTTTAADRPPAIPAPTPSSTSTTEPVPTVTAPAPVVTRLEPHDLWVFPGPAVYHGDEVDIEVPTFGTAAPEIEDLVVTWDEAVVDVQPAALVDPIVGGRIALHAGIPATVGTHELVVTATVDDAPLERRRTVTVRPASERPVTEAGATWRTVTTACCTVSAVTGTGSGDDLDAIAAELDRVAATVAARFGVDPDGDVDIILLANPWGNGGFANPGMTVLSLPALDPSPSDRRTLFVHELTHVMSGRVADPPTPFDEGLAVQAAGGHYAVAPLREYAAALTERGFLRPLATLFDDFAELQHERRYLQAGAFVQWVVDTAGESAVQAMLRHDPGREVETASGWLDSATTAVLGTDLDATDLAFRRWLDGADPDVVATAPVAEAVRLQELRRRWQRQYAPWEALYDVLDGVDDLADLDPVRAVRRASDPAHVAVESLFAEAQQAFAAGERGRVASIHAALEPVVDTGRITPGPVADRLTSR